MTIPHRLKELPRQGEFPIPFIVLIDSATNLADFAATDMERWTRCMKEQLCGICGKPLDYWIWFIGGPQSMVARTFFDPGMHEECARYSLSVCPYLSGLKGYRPAPRQHDGVRIEVNHQMLDSDETCLGRTRGYEVDYAEHTIHAAPFKSVETFQRKHQ